MIIPSNENCDLNEAIIMSNQSKYSLNKMSLDYDEVENINDLNEILHKSLLNGSEATYDDSRSNNNMANFSFRELCEEGNGNNEMNIKKAVLCENDIVLLQEYLIKEKTMCHERKIKSNNKSLQNIKKGINSVEKNIEKYLDIPFDKEKKNSNKFGKLHITKLISSSSNNKLEEDKKIKVKEGKSFEEDFNFELDDF